MTFMDALRRLSSSPKEAEGASGGPTSPRTNVWSSTFDPGSNSAGMKKVGASYYDKPDPNNPGNVWDQHLKAESNRPASPSSPAAAGMDADALRKAFASDRVEAALKQADPAGAGKVDFEKFMSIMRQGM